MICAKQNLRATMSVRKKDYSLEEKKRKSAVIFNKLSKTEKFCDAKTILCYWSMSDEVYTHDFVVKYCNEKRFFLPVVSGDTLLIREFSGVECLSVGETFSILEPDSNAANVDIAEIDLVIVPGVALDLNGGRLGRGKGYYDKLLAHAKAFKIGVCFDFQVVEKVPMDECDILMDQLIFG